MASKTLLIVLSFLLLCSLSAAHNITAILEGASDGKFTAFNDLLTRTNLAASINRRKTITVLAVDNSAIGSFSGLDNDTLKSLLAVHVILDYYDSMKLGKLKGSVVLTTLFQASGIAQERMGFVNMTKFPTEHRIALRSAIHGAPFTSDIVGPIMSNPYNISVLHVSGAILTRDIYNLNFTVAPPPPKVAEAPTPAVSTPAPAPADANATAPAPATADAPTPAAHSPSPADAPSSDVAPSPEPEDAIVEDEEAPSKSSAGRVAAGAGLGFAISAMLMGL